MTGRSEGIGERSAVQVVAKGTRRRLVWCFLPVGGRSVSRRLPKTSVLTQGPRLCPLAVSMVAVTALVGVLCWVFLFLVRTDSF